MSFNATIAEKFRGVFNEELKCVFLKEARDLSRDKMLVFGLILTTVVLYPLFFIGSIRVLQARATLNERHLTRVGLLGQSDALEKIFGHQSKRFSLERESDSDDAMRKLRLGKLDVVLEVPENFDQHVTESKQPKLNILLNESKDFQADKTRVESSLASLEQDLQSKRVVTLGLSPDLASPMTIDDKNEASDERRSGAMLALSLPMTLVTVLFLFTAIPAFDLIIGERTRKSLETILASPAKRSSILLAKLLVCFVVGLVAAAAILTSSTICVNLAHPIAVDMQGSFALHVSPQAAVLSLLISIPAALLLSSISVLISSASRTLQQASGYAAPYSVLVVLLASTAMLPLQNFPFAIYLVPVSNVAVCINALFMERWSWSGVIVTFIANGVAALYLCSLAVELFAKEELLFGIDVAPSRQTEFGRQIAILYSIAFLLMFYVGQLSLMLDAFWGIFCIQLLVVLAPSLALLKWLKQPFKDTLSLRSTSWRNLLGAVLVTPGLVMCGMFIARAQSWVLPSPTALEKAFGNMIAPAGQPLWMTLLTVAFLPGICEELMFRGVILGLLRKKHPMWNCCFVVGALFGLFHLSTYRLLPTGFLGVLLTWLVFRTGSIFPSMLVHMTNNGLSVLMLTRGIEKIDTPTTIAALVSTAVGAWLIFSNRQNADR